jgi:hypothetical protein
MPVTIFKEFRALRASKSIMPKQTDPEIKTFFRKIFREQVRAKKRGVKNAKAENAFICEKVSGYGMLNRTYKKIVQEKTAKNSFTRILLIHNILTILIMVKYTQMSPTNFICPNCKKEISIDEAMRSRLEDDVRKTLRLEYNQKWLDEKKKLEAGVGDEIKKEYEEKLHKQKIELERAEEFEKRFRKKAEELEEKQRKMDLELQRQIDEERKKIQEKTAADLTEQFHLKVKEKDSTIESLKKSLEEASRKASVGSQQLQGEVMELELEEILKQEFPIDEIVGVGKGVKGADLIQIVKNSLGRESGKIIWESKRTKAFGGDWIEKLKVDMRAQRADIAVLISTTLPPGVDFFAFREGVYICGFEAFIHLAAVLRKTLIDLSAAKSLSVGKNERIEALYKYITSVEFAQKIETMMETFMAMSATLEKEKMNTLKIWAQREKEIEKLKNSTLTIHGSLSGLLDKPLQEIEVLEYRETVIDLEIEENDK